MSTDTQSEITTPNKGRVAKRGGIAALAVVAGCALACSLPLLIGVGTVSSIGAFMGGWQIAGIALIAVAVAGGIWWFVRRQRATARRAQAAADGQTDNSCDTSCGCGGC